MKRAKAFVAILCFIAIMANGQSVQRRSSSYISIGGMVYFLVPMSVPPCEGEASFHYDVTYNIKRDSVTLNFTVSSASQANVTGLALIGVDTLVCANPHIIYVEKKKNKYIYRVSTSYPFADLCRLYATTSRPLKFEVQRQGAREKFMYPEGKWKKETKVINEIFELIKLQQ